MKIRRITAMVVAIIMILGLNIGTEVFATGAIITHFFDPVDGEVITISIDVIQTGEGIYGIEFSSPRNINTPKNTADLIPYGMIRIYNNQVLFRANGGWIAPNQLTQSGISSVPFTQNEWHNIKLRVTRAEKLAELYIDEEYAGSMNLMSELPNPAHLVRVFSQGEKNFEMKFISSVGSRKGEMSARIDEHDAKNKEITVTFSEALNGTGALSGTAMKAMNSSDGEHKVSLSVKEAEGSVVKFGYRDTLKLSTEYAIVLPEGLIGKNDGLLKGRYLYFATEPATAIKVDDSCDYEDGEAKFWVEQPNNVNPIVETKDGHGNVFYVRVRKSVDDNLVLNGFKAPVSDVSSLSFDIQPIKENLKLAVEIGSSSANAAPVYLVFGENGYVLCKRASAVDSEWYTQSSGANNKYINDLVGNYEANKWMNFKVKYDNNRKCAEVYMDGRLVKTLDEIVMSGFNGFGGLKYIIPAQGNVRTALFYMDNFKNEVETIVPAVIKTCFNSATGASFGGAEEIGRLISSIDIGFETEMDDSSLNGNTITLLYDGDEIDYTGYYDEAEKTYRLIPDTVPNAKDEIILTVSGATDISGDEMQSFVLTGTADDTADGLQVFEMCFADADGNRISEFADGTICAKTVVANLTNDERTVLVSAMGYKNGALEKYAYKLETLAPNSVFVTDSEQNTVKFSSSTIDSAMITVQDAETGIPLAEACKLIRADITETEGKIKLSGEAEGETSIEVYAPDKSFADMNTADDFHNVLIYKTQILADGEYECDFNIEYAEAESGMYTVKVANENKSDSYQILYVNETNAEKVFTELFKPAINSKDAEEAAKILLENKFDLYVDDRYIDGDVAKKAVQLIIENGVTLDEAETVINKAVAIAAFEEGKIDNILAEDEIFDLGNTDIADLYNASYVRENTAEDITERMNDQDFDSIEDFDEKLTESFALAVVKNPAEPGCVKTVLGELGIRAKKDKYYSEISGNDYDTLKELKDDLEDMADAEKPKNNGSSGGGGGRNSGVSAIARDVVEKDDEKAEISEQTDKAYFADLNSVEWAEEAINALAENNIINGKYDKHFCPNDYITREEFTKIIVSALEINADADIDFSDVEDGAWYYDFIRRAYGAGVVKGYDDGRFGIGDLITREDMAVMIYRSASESGIKFGNPESGSRFTDDAEIADYAKTAVYSLKNANVINGRDGGMFAPDAYATRAEAAKMIYNILGR